MRVREAMISFVRRISSQDGRYAQLAVTGAKNADSRFVIAEIESGGGGSKFHWHLYVLQTMIGRSTP